MKIIALNTMGVRPAPIPSRGENWNGEDSWILTHGKPGEDQWMLILPLGKKDFPPPPGGCPTIGKEEVALLPTRHKDGRGNRVFVVIREANAPDHAIKEGQLVFWSLEPGKYGSARWEIEGQARVIGRGRETSHPKTRRGAQTPLVHVTGPCRLTWTRNGRLYGDPPNWIAVFDGQRWAVGDEDSILLEEAAARL